MSVGERIPNTFKYYISFASGCGDIAIGSRTQAVGGWGGGGGQGARDLPKRPSGGPPG